jgi:hypothetical protein
MKSNISKKEELKNSLVKKELVKPLNFNSAEVKEVESLCGELRSCGSLRRQSGDSTGTDTDILF